MKIEDVSFVKAGVDNWEIYKEIRLDTLKQEPIFFSSRYGDALLYSDDKWKSILSDSMTTYYLAMMDEKAIAVARVTFNDPDESIETAIFGGLYIKKDYRNLGIARELVKKRIDESKQRGVNKLRVYIKSGNLPAIKLYESFKFTRIAVKDGEFVMEYSLKK